MFLRIIVIAYLLLFVSGKVFAQVPDIASLREKAEQGDAGAQYNLGMMSFNGQGVPQDYGEAVKWWRKAAEQGYTDAQFLLGGMYYNGRGLPRDDTEAVKWYRKAAEQGVADAQAVMGALYAQGRGVSQDYVQAHMWLNLAAANDTTGKIYPILRDKIAASMTPVQIAKAQKLAREWHAAHPRK